MRLLISSSYESSFVEDECHLKTSMLQMKATHLFIASNVWESIVLDIEDTIPEGCLRSLNLVSDNIKVRLPEDVTEKTIHLLTELYPSLSGKIRRLYMCGQSVKGVLGECLVL